MPSTRNQPRLSSSLGPSRTSSGLEQDFEPGKSSPQALSQDKVTEPIARPFTNEEELEQAQDTALNGVSKAYLLYRQLKLSDQLNKHGRPMIAYLCKIETTQSLAALGPASLARKKVPAARLAPEEEPNSGPDEDLSVHKSEVNLDNEDEYPSKGDLEEGSEADEEQDRYTSGSCKQTLAKICAITKNFTRGAVLSASITLMILTLIWLATWSRYCKSSMRLLYKYPLQARLKDQI
ncbi:hypothetical protein H4Q26_004926 [Puccinia striiformis f. sp. tritici PST-130]|nr:hypothetical protein H4Q26_004926 [Puccinia striiformis f. sp. tritici PST-130]